MDKDGAYAKIIGQIFESTEHREACSTCKTSECEQPEKESCCTCKTSECEQPEKESCCTCKTSECEQPEKESCCTVRPPNVNNRKRNHVVPVENQ